MRTLALAVAAWVAWPAIARAQAPADDGFPPLYHAQDQDSWDFWYVESDRQFFAFYLQAPIDQPVRFSHPTIGLATSKDLLHWSEVGEVIRANPPGMWNDSWVATGSVMRVGGMWKKIFTGHTHTGRRGLAAATSVDLQNWSREGVGGPLRITSRPFTVPSSRYWQDRGFAPGHVLTYEVLADPYVMPDPIDGWYYMVVSGLIDGEPPATRGCVGLLRSRDGDAWEDMGILSAPRIYNENEAPQIWKHGDRWYLMFGAANAEPLYRATMVFASPSLFGPFEPNPRSEITLPNWTGWFYVAKVVRAPSGQDVLLGGVGGRLSRPYPVTYEADGSLTLAEYDPAVSRWPFETTFMRAPAPNPARGGTTVAYGLVRAGVVSIEVFDVAGRRVRTLANGRAEEGAHRAHWNTRDDGGRKLAAGVYLVRMTADGMVRSQKVVVAE